MTEEKSSLHKQFKRDLEDLKMTHEEDSESLKQQFEKEADALVQNHQAEINVMKAEVGYLSVYYVEDFLQKMMFL